VTLSKDKTSESWALKMEKRFNKGMSNIFNKIIAGNLSNLKKEMPIQVQESHDTPNRHYQNRPSPQHFIIETISTEKKERILKAVRGEKNQITYKCNSIKITADFSTKTLKARKA
jgi:hypothetical protein